MREPRTLDLRVSAPGGGYHNIPPWQLPQAPAVPFIAEGVTNDDDNAEMAGIVRSPTSRAHRLWSRPVQPDRHNDIPGSATAVEARKHVHRSVLRRLIRRPPLDKTRSLFVMPTTMTAGDRMMISGWMPPRLAARPVVVSDRGRSTLSTAEANQMTVERRHRRCHSEQPRSWREPSASLWTLKEE